MISVLIVDDHAMFRAGLKQIIADEADINVTGESATAQDALNKIELAGLFDVVLLDISLPDKNGLELLGQIKQKFPKLPVLLLTMFPEEQYAIRGIRLGAAGYLTKDCEPDQLFSAIRKAAAGGRFISEMVAEKLAEALDSGSSKPLHSQLSNREFQIFLAIAQGETSAEIAKTLSLSVKTVATYRSRIMEKMGMSKNAEIIIYAIENQLFGA